MSFPCPSCRREIAVEAVDGGRPICAGCGRMWSVTPMFLEGVSRARREGGTIHSICWRDVPLDGLGQLGVAFLYFVLISAFWISLPAAAFFLYMTALTGLPIDPDAERMPQLSLVAAAAGCVGVFFGAQWLLGRFHHFSRGAVATYPTVIVASGGIFDVVSFKDVFHVPWTSVVSTHYSHNFLEESLLIDFTTTQGVCTIETAMAGAAKKRPLWDAAFYIEEQRNAGRDDPETAIRDEAARQRIQ